jgi:hypothetical protein|uniref:Uncharacterized protein n=1 Tax=Fagus sylvatica TaxID=28930 RepID=A0A2N9EZC1_FAGSY
MGKIGGTGSIMTLFPMYGGYKLGILHLDSYVGAHPLGHAHLWSLGSMSELLVPQAPALRLADSSNEP